MRYGFHHARAADALTWLLNNQVDMASEEIPGVLTCRSALISTHAHRLELAVRGANVEWQLFGSRAPRRDIRGIAKSSPVIMAELLGDVPRHEEHTVALSDVLRVEDPSPTLQAWTEAARHATLATETVATSRGWVGRPRQAWQVVADTGDSVEALDILDGRLALTTQPVLPDWEAVHRLQSASLRLVARQSASLARSGELDPTTDGLVRHEAVTRPLQLSGFEDIVQGMQLSERFAMRYPMSIDELRSFALMQSDIASDCVRLVPNERLASLREAFNFREVRFRQLAAATTRVASIGRPGGRPLLAQTAEIGRVIRSASTSNEPAVLGVLAEFDSHYPLLSRALARGIDRAFAGGHYLVPDDVSIAARWRKVQPAEEPPLVRAAGEVVAVAGPAVPELQWKAQRLAGWDRTANQRQADRDQPTPLKVSRPPYRALAADAEPSAARAREGLRNVLDREPLDRPVSPNKRNLRNEQTTR